MKKNININLNKIMKDNKSLFLVYDHGMEYGAIDFDNKNVDPLYIIDIAKKGKFSAVIFQKGIAEKYKNEIKKSKIPLILKLNGKTNLVGGDPISSQLATVKEAYELGAIAVGYTIYIGSQYESKMFHDIANIEREAHKLGMPVIAWIYPRGSGIKKRTKIELMSYATRVALEIGVDMVKIQPVGNLRNIAWAVRSAGKVKVIGTGGIKENEKDLLKEVKMYINAGCSGIAMGRNVWKNKNPIELTKKLKKIIW